MILVFDCETNGLPKNYQASAEDVENWPRVTSLAYSVYNKEGELIKRVANLIKPDGWVLPTKESLLAEGKSIAEAEKGAKFFAETQNPIEVLNEKGIPILQALEEYVKDRLEAEFAVAHNISFDSKVLRAEMFRAGITTEFTAKKICTMMKTISFCKVPYPSGKKGNKFPSLSELHNILFNGPFEGAHDAGADVDACAKCLFELIKLGVISLA